METPLLKGKVHAPQPGPGLVERPRLRKVLEALLEPGACLLLLSAPAGFGKSTLLGGWLAGGGAASFAWLTLDPEDNDPVRFWSYLLFSLRQAHPSFGQPALQALAAPRLPPAAPGSGLRSALTLTLNELGALPGTPVIVLDDFHRIDSQEIHDSLSHALEHWPENARLVLSTRVDPPLPLARLRATGRLAEIRTADLRFSAEEAALFLREALDGPLDAEQMRLLDQRTEGWIAGLKMATLAMKGAADSRPLLAGLAAGTPFILDYLAEEVLDRQEAELQEFLLRTAILDRFCGALCDALTGAGRGQDTLLELSRRNLFLIQLDEEPTWFRYHPLFADLLRARLRRLHPELAQQMHRRASRWFAENGLPDEAFQHARTAGDAEQIVELVLRHSRRLTFSGWSATVERWLAAIPEQMVRDDLRLIVSRCWTRCFTNHWRSLKEDLDRVEELLESPPPGESAIRANAATTVAILRGYLALRENGPEAALKVARRAARQVAEAPPVLQGAALAILGYALKATGALEEAGDAFRRAGPLLLSQENLTAWAISLRQLAEVLIALGHLRKAQKAATEALRLLEERQGLRLPAACYLYLAAAEAAWLAGEPVKAESFWQEASSLEALTGDQEAALRCALGRSRLLAARGQSAQALELLAQVESGARSGRLTAVTAELADQRCALWSACGRLEELRHWTQEPVEEGSDGWSSELQGIARVRALVALGLPEAAMERSAKLLEEARAGGRLGRAVPLLALRALADWQRGKRESALSALRQGLEIAAPEGLLWSILGEGPGLWEPVSELLVRYGTTASSAGSRKAAVRDFLRDLLAAYGPAGPGPPDASSASALGKDSELGAVAPQTLTAREREVLELLAAGHSNREIADRLFVSLATVKKHVSAVLGKLGAGNRTRAVALARRHSLL